MYAIWSLSINWGGTKYALSLENFLAKTAYPSMVSDPDMTFLKSRFAILTVMEAHGTQTCEEETISSTQINHIWGCLSGFEEDASTSQPGGRELAQLWEY